MGEGKLLELVMTEGFQETIFKWRHARSEGLSFMNTWWGHIRKRDQQVQGLRNGTVPATFKLNKKASTAITYLLLYSQWMRWRMWGEGSCRVKTRLWRAHGQYKTAAVYLKAEVKPFTCIWREEASYDSHLLSWGYNKFKISQWLWISETLIEQIISSKKTELFLFKKCSQGGSKTRLVIYSDPVPVSIFHKGSQAYTLALDSSLISACFVLSLLGTNIWDSFFNSSSQNVHSSSVISVICQAQGWILSRSSILTIFTREASLN